MIGLPNMKLVDFPPIFTNNDAPLQDLKQTLLTTKAGMQFMQMKFHEEMQNIGRVNALDKCSPFFPFFSMVDFLS